MRLPLPLVLASLWCAPVGLGATQPPQAMRAADADAPDRVALLAGPVKDAPSYSAALQLWRDAKDLNDWMGANFAYDGARALQLSETQRQQGLRLPIHSPDAFFASPMGVCVDLARFGVETLRAIDPRSAPAYLMIEFDPVLLSGQSLRRHWLASFRRDGRLYFFADSRRPGTIAGPYADTAAFVADYARYRGRAVVGFSELPSYERQTRKRAARTAAPSPP